jgi:hypothetical protein
MTGKRRSPGTGGVHGYQTNAGQRWYFKATVAGKRIVRRGFPNAKAAHAALHSLLSGNPGQPVGPRRSWACLVPECFDRSVTEPPARREWFEATPELEAFIASLGPLGSKPGITPRDAPEITRVAS